MDLLSEFNSTSPLVNTNPDRPSSVGPISLNDLLNPVKISVFIWGSKGDLKNRYGINQYPHF